MKAGLAPLLLALPAHRLALSAPSYFPPRSTLSLSDDGTVVGAWLRKTAGLEPARREHLALPINLSLKFAVLILAVPLIMLQWGYAWPDIREWYWQLFFGLHIGNTEVTSGALLASIIVFGVGYAAARLFQGWLDAQVLQQAGISGGVRNSIRTGVGYMGILIAALVAVSYAGFNLSSIAIVAGALSVGIGFGLQNLVNNFVSGVILLVERPIRVGDLVVVGGEEGYVRKNQRALHRDRNLRPCQCSRPELLLHR